MSIFAFYFAAHLLTDAGWPRKLGRFKGEGYDMMVADAVFDQSIDWGAALGAGRPGIAVQMIAHMVRGRDWDSDDAPNVKMVVEGLSEGTWAGATSPQEAVQRVQFSDHMATMTYEQFNRRETKMAVEQPFLEALLWGLSNPDQYEAWYRAHLAEYEQKLPTYQAGGLDVGPLPSLEENYENSEQIVRDYERDLDELPPIPERLLADARALDWRV
jgi:hypothetical protein